MTEIGETRVRETEDGEIKLEAVNVDQEGNFEIVEWEPIE